MPKPTASVTEGRAGSARPSARLLRPSARLLFVLLGALLLAAAAAPSAWAVPETPSLDQTNPSSPGTALNPRIKGSGNSGEGTSSPAAIGPLAAAIGPLTAGPEMGSFTIKIYANDECAEPVASEGTREELEGSGIEVTVEPGSVTTFTATQTDPTDPTEPSDCSQPLTYRHVIEPPEPPVFEATNPTSPANDNFPRLIGSADPEATVTIYATADCSGPPLGSGSGAQFSSGIQLSEPVADNSTTTFHGTATLAGFESACSSSSIVYEEVTPPEEPPEEEEPPAEEEPPSEGGGGPGNEGGGSPSPSPPASGSGAPDVPGSPPAPTLRTIPGGRANFNTPLVAAVAPGAATVKVFGAAGCKGPALLVGSAAQLAAGVPIRVVDNATLTLYGVSVDGGGDRSRCSAQPAVYVEDSIAPHVRITAGPGVKTRRRKVVFRFSDVTGDPSAVFRCRLDRRKWRRCRSPLRLRHVKRRRKHVVRVKAFDGAGNRQRRAVKRRFKVIGGHRAHRRR
jgi:hypothetical protein